MKTFRFHWLSGQDQEAEGSNASEAFHCLSLGGRTLPALDYWEEIAGVDRTVPGIDSYERKSQ